MNVLIKLRSEMKAYSLLILGLFLVLAQVACKKNLLQLATVSTSLNPTIQNEAEVSLGSIVTIIGNITNDGGAPVVERGICYTSFQTNDVKSHSDPTINNSVLKDTGIGSGSFVMTMNPSNANATYVIRAYARTKAGVAYGKALTVRTAANKKTVIGQPIAEVEASVPKFPEGLSFNVKLGEDLASYPLKSMKVELYEVNKTDQATNYLKLHTAIIKGRDIQKLTPFDFFKNDLVNLPKNVSIKPKTSYRIDVLVVNVEEISKSISKVIKTQ